MGQNPPYAILEFLDGNHYFPVNVVHTDRGISQRPGTDGSQTSDNLLASILHSRSMTQVSFLELRRAILRFRELKAEGRISSAEAEFASVIRLWNCMNA